MKKLLMASIIAVVLSIGSLANAAGIGDTIEPLGNGKVSVSIINNNILEKDYEPSGNVTKANLDEMNETYAKIAIGAGDNLNLYVMLGMINSAELTEDWTQASTNYTTKFETDSDFLWGLGSSSAYEFGNKYFIGSDFHYIAWEADVDKIEESGESATNIKGGYEYYELQGSIYAGKRFESSPEISLIPYAGFFYNYSEIESDGDITCETTTAYYTHKGDIENDDKFGIMLGANMEIAKSFLLNVEGRFIAEEAFTISGTYKF